MKKSKRVITNESETKTKVANVLKLSKIVIVCLLTSPSTTAYRRIEVLRDR